MPIACPSPRDDVPQTLASWPTRTVVTLTSLCHLTLVAGVNLERVHSSDLKQEEAS
jgi:hypothetical protein